MSEGTARAMPQSLKTYVRWVDSLNKYVGLFAMYMVFAMIAILMYSSFARVFHWSNLWTLEMAQFVMAAYYMLGGGYSLQDDSHVRMDLLYSRWSPRGKAAMDAVTVLALLFYLALLLWGGFSSTSYAVYYGETSYSSWSPYMWPIKVIMCIGIVLIMLQAMAVFFKNVAEARGEDLS
jgi:TRAP-type mannitol/chloroaromatic compound transport system permease small subunit